jgi:hypothetical protein
MQADEVCNVRMAAKQEFGMTITSLRVGENAIA